MTPSCMTPQRGFEPVGRTTPLATLSGESRNQPARRLPPSSRSIPFPAASAAAATPRPERRPALARPNSPRSIGEILLRRRLELDLTQDQIAERASIAKSYVSQIENHARKYPPSADVLERLERALELDRGTLQNVAQWETTPDTVRQSLKAVLGELRSLAGQGRLDEMYRSGRLAQWVSHVEGAPHGAPVPPPAARSPAHLAPPRPSLPHAPVPVDALMPAEIPLINSVAAGYPCEFTDLGYPARIASEYVRSADVRDRDAFAARVVGDSMSPDYREGDIVVFSPAKAVQHGMDCFVRLEPDHESTFKRVFFDVPDAGGQPVPPGAGWESLRQARLRLHPLNPKYPERIVEREQVAGLYAAVSVTRSLA